MPVRSAMRAATVVEEQLGGLLLAQTRTPGQVIRCSAVKCCRREHPRYSVNLVMAQRLYNFATSLLRLPVLGMLRHLRPRPQRVRRRLASGISHHVDTDY